MITSIYSGGGLGNQLIFATNLLASALKKNISYKNISFKAQIYFDIESPLQKSFICTNIWGGYSTILLQKYVKLCLKLKIRPIGIKCIFNDIENSLDFIYNKTGYLYCWPYYDYKALYEYQDVVRESFIIKEELMNPIINKITFLRKSYDVIVGVHIRRKDYEHWLGGKYYFDFDTYNAYLNNFKSNFKDERLLFILLSDDNIPKEKFDKDKKIYIPSKKSEIDDLLLLSKCNYIIGPPSTFSGWASFWGNVPKYTILDPNKKNTNIVQKDFGVYMIDYIDDNVDDNGFKILQKIKNGEINNKGDI